jgi:hypothetical protein
VLVAVASATNVTEVLRLDLLVTDAYHPPAHPTFLYYNPTAAAVWVEVTNKHLNGSASGQSSAAAPVANCSGGKSGGALQQHGLYDLYDGGSGERIAAAARVRYDGEKDCYPEGGGGGGSASDGGSASVASVMLPADSARIVVLTGANSVASWNGQRLVVGGMVVRY